MIEEGVPHSHMSLKEKGSCTVAAKDKKARKSRIVFVRSIYCGYQTVCVYI